MNPPFIGKIGSAAPQQPEPQPPIISASQSAFPQFQPQPGPTPPQFNVQPQMPHHMMPQVSGPQQMSPQGMGPMFQHVGVQQFPGSQIQGPPNSGPMMQGFPMQGQPQGQPMMQSFQMQVQPTMQGRPMGGPPKIGPPMGGLGGPPMGYPPPMPFGSQPYQKASLKLVSQRYIQDANYQDDELITIKVVEERKSSELIEDKLLVTTKCALSPIQVTGAAQEVPCMVSLRGVSKDLEEIERARPGLDLVCVIDISGSMSGMKIDLVRQTLEFLVTKLTPSDRLSLVIFDNSAYRVCPLLTCTPAGRTTLEDFINRLDAEGGTNMIEGLECGLKVLAGRRVVNTVTSLFLLSDGVDNEVSTALARSQAVMTRFRDMIKGDFTVHTFGYGSDHDSNVMCNLADQGLGAFHFVEKLESIAEAFADSFGGLVSQVAKNVEVRLEVIPGPVACRVTKLYTKTATQHFTLPAVMANESKDFVFILEVGPGELQAVANFPAVAAEVRYSLVGGREIVEKVELTLECAPAGGEVALNVREDVLVNFYRVKGAEILKEATALAEQRLFDRSRQCLQQGVDELRASLVATHVLVDAIITDLEDAKNRVRDQSAWQMGGAAQVKSTFNNHYGQSASSNAQCYAQPQQMAYNMQFQAYQQSKRP